MLLCRRVEDDEERADKKDERRKKAAGGKAGGGAQGRETKTKSTANKKRPPPASKGQQREMVFSLIASYLGQKERILDFFNVVLIFTELGQDLIHLAHKENTQRKLFLLGRLTNLHAFCSLRASI
jgi:hypothetical protein